MTAKNPYKNIQGRLRWFDFRSSGELPNFANHDKIKQENGKMVRW